MKRMTVAIYCVIATFLITMSCKHEILNDSPTGNGSQDPSNPNDTTPLSGIACNADTVYYQNTIEPLIISSCASTGCHDAASHKEGLNLTTYNNIKKLVVPGKASESKLYKVIIEKGEDRMPPEPSDPLTASQVNSIKTWINQGAKKNQCDACDSTNIKFSTGIFPIIQNKCIGCHNNNNAGGGIDLSSYTKIYPVAISGKLLGSVQWKSGYSKMPQGGMKLPDCEILQLEKWIANGAKND